MDKISYSVAAKALKGLSGKADIEGTCIVLPVGDNTDRPTLSADARAIRANTDINGIEEWDGTTWKSVSADITAVSIKGTDTEANILASTGNSGDVWVASDTLAGWLYVDDRWVSIGQLKGPQGVGVSEVSLTGTVGLVDTYEMSFTDGTTESYQVTNGKDGSVWLVGAADPTTEGTDSDMYINTTSYDIFQKVSGVWVLSGNLKGPVGEGLTILGSFADESELPVTGSLGDGYLIDGYLYVWSGSSWDNVGFIQGPQGPQGIQGVQGEAGTGITSVVRTSGTGAVGTIDTYTITYTDASTSTFNVTNGADARSVTDISRTDGTGDVGTVDTYTITYSDASTSRFTVTNGNEARSIVSVLQSSGTGAAGTVDTYEITFNDATTSSFNVYNGKDGNGTVVSIVDGTGISVDSTDPANPVINVTIVDDSTTTADTVWSSQKVSDELGLKVDAVTGKQLSTEDYTAAEKSKLAALESSKFLGLYTSLAALQAAHPTAVDGNYADVDGGAGTAVLRYLWDVSDTEWVALQGESSELTDSQVKTKYESNPDTNAFTDAEKSKLAGVGINAEANTVDSVAGKTGSVVLDRTDVGLDQVDNTSDLDKPISTATQAALDSKVDVVAGKQLSTEDFTTLEKSKLAGVEGSATNTPINDSATSTSSVWSSQKVSDALSGVSFFSKAFNRSVFVGNSWVEDITGFAGTVPNIALYGTTPAGTVSGFEGMLSSAPDAFTYNDSVVGIYDYGIGLVSHMSGYDLSIEDAGADLYVGGEVSYERSLALSQDGTKLYVVDDNSDRVHQYTLSAPWDISTAVYDSKYYSVRGQESNPSGISFKSDGSKMYVTGTSSDSVQQYSLAVPWDVSTAVYDSKSFSVRAQESAPRDLYLSQDGAKLFVVGTGSDSVQQYSLSTAWDISTAAYDNKFFSVSGQEGSPYGLFFNPDGDKMYVTGMNSDSVHQYNLSVPWDIATAAYSSISFSLSQYGNQCGVFFKPDGEFMYVIYSDYVRQFATNKLIVDTSTPVQQVTSVPTVTGYWTSLNSIISDKADNSGFIQYVLSFDEGLSWFIIPEGQSTFRYIVRNNLGTWEYNTDDTYSGTTWAAAASESDAFEQAITVSNNLCDSITPYKGRWDVSLAVYDNIATTTREGSTYGLHFSSDGKEMYTIGYSGDSVIQQTLNTPWDVSTAVYNNKSFSVSGQEGGSSGLFFKPDGTKMYICGTGSDSVLQYSLSTAWDVSTAVYDSKSFRTYAQDTSVFGIFLNPAGDKMYVIGDSSDSVYQYNLAVPWDVSTATYSYKSFSVSGQEGSPYGLFFNSTGGKMYICGTGSDSVHQYGLAVPWDVSTAVYDNKLLDASGQETTTTSMFFKPDGTRVYVTGINNDKVHQYSIGTEVPQTFPELGDSCTLRIVYDPATGSSDYHNGLVISYDAAETYRLMTPGVDYEAIEEADSITFISNFDGSIKGRIL